MFTPYSVWATIYLQDGFESGNLSSPTGVGSWGASNYSKAGGDLVSVSSEFAHSGSYALRMLYNGNESSSDDAWCEQNFNIGQNVLEIYIGYDLYLPANYAFRSTSPANNKLILLDGGTHDDPMTVDVEWEGDSYGGFKMPRSGYPYSPTCASAPVSPGYIWGGAWPLSTYYGGWHRFVWRFKMDSGVGDGAYELYIDGVQFFSRTNVVVLNNPPCSPGYYAGGYLMGWANTGFDDDTIIYIDDVVMASTYEEANGDDSPSTPSFTGVMTGSIR